MQCENINDCDNQIKGTLNVVKVALLAFILFLGLTCLNDI